MWEAEEWELSEWVKTLLRVLSPSVPTIGLEGKNQTLLREKKEMLVQVKITKTLNLL